MEFLTDAVLHGKYRIERPLGEGGMGAVYLAEHVGIGRRVALKVIRPELLADATAAERFTREARAAGGLQHPHVVNVTDFGVDRVAGHDVAYLVMEALQGETLESVLEARGALRLPQVVDIVAQVAAALEAAHARGVVHRDLKPANIWLTPDHRGGFHVTLLDFGIAKLRDDTFVPATRTVAHDETPPSIAVAPAAASPMTTQAGESLGTPAYMSPEQCVGDAIDARSDLYSLGVVVYQMLSGALPFRGDTVSLLRQHFVAEVPPLPATANVPAPVEAVVRRALSKDPAARFQSAPAFAAALRAHAMGFGESMRRALTVFAERMPELSVLGLCFALPGVVATVLGFAIGLAWVPMPFNLLPWMLLLNVALFCSTPVAMAGIATVFHALREQPFTTITWRAVAAGVVQERGAAAPHGAVALYAAWVRAALGRYLETVRSVRSGGVAVMLHFVDRYRHGGTRTAPERLARMGATLPGGAFASMMIAQLSAILLLPILALLCAYGVSALLGVGGMARTVVLTLAACFAFTTALFLQVFIALVDVMLYDVARDMTGD
ncbi:MAG: serine/threonine protein kinase [Gemmatimonadetes bacterium]|nr:serine/threonine protein kinase [Gemmatimonadota bacterium]